MALAIPLAALTPGGALAQEPRVEVIELGSAGGEPGEVVEVPARATIMHAVCGYIVLFSYDDTRLDFLEYRPVELGGGGSLAVRGVFQDLVEGRGTFGLFSCLESGDPRVPPGEKVLLGHLRFQIRARAREGAIEVRPRRSLSGLEGETFFTFDAPIVSGSPETLLPGEILVGAPTGPRPVDNLACEQVLDEVKLSFWLTETYDTIEVARDGLPIASLPGSVNEFSEPLSHLGKLEYAVTARRGGVPSVSVTCEVLAVSPAAPAVTSFQCLIGHLGWRNPLSYDRISVFRNGERIADLPGSSMAFQDPGPEEPLIVYSIVAEAGGYPSPETHCIRNGVWIMEAGDVQAPLDASLIEVPIYVTTPNPVNAIEAHADVDLERFEVPPLSMPGRREAALRGTVGYPEPEFFGMSIGPHTKVPVVAVGYDVFPPSDPAKHLPPGLRQHVMSFLFRPTGTFTDGEVFPVPFVFAGFTLGGEAIRPEVFIHGQIRMGAGGLAPVRGLAAAVEPRGDGGGAQAGAGAEDIVLRWVNDAPYERVRIERNGSSVAELPGDAEEYRDLAVSTSVLTYKVIAEGGGETSFPATTFLSTFYPRGAFLRGDANRDGGLDLSDALATLAFLFQGAAPLPCEDAADTDDDGELNVTDPIATLGFLFLGRGVPRPPGVRYPWFDPTPDGLTCRS